MSSPLLVVQHVPWEGPHRILGAFEDREVLTVRPLEGEALPDRADVAGAVFMGGPMGVNDTGAHPGLAEEVEWIAGAHGAGLPLLGVCLGSQLIATALGAEVRPGPAPEIGFATVRIHDPGDPILGGLAPDTAVLHWHGEVFDLPDGAQHLAWSARTQVQAFRHGNTWGVLFHPEADQALVESWLEVPAMAAEADAALGPDAASTIRAQAERHGADLVARSTPGFRAFADLVAA
jgi:GMP synthase (glutamine-hydrolysing)